MGRRRSSVLLPAKGNLSGRSESMDKARERKSSNVTDSSFNIDEIKHSKSTKTNDLVKSSPL